MNIPNDKKLRVQTLVVKGRRFVHLLFPYPPIEEQEFFEPTLDVEKLPIRDLSKNKLSQILTENSDFVEFLPIKVMQRKEDLEALDTSEFDCILVLTGLGETQDIVKHMNMFGDMKKIIYGAEVLPTHTIWGGYAAIAGDTTLAALDTADVNLYLKAEYALKRMRNSKVVMFGDISPSIVDNPQNLSEWSDKFGVEFIKISIEELQERIEKIDTELVIKEANKLRDNARTIEIVGDDDFRKAKALSMAMVQFVLENHADAMSMDCCELFVAGGVAPCIGIHDVENLSIPSACEGDLNCLMMKMLLHFLSGADTFMGNLGSFNVEEECFCVWHHTAPKSFFKDGVYGLNSYGGMGVHYVSDVVEGTKVTVAKLSKDIKRATLVDSYILHSSEHGHCVAMDIKLPSVRDYVNNHLLGNHHVVGLGNYGKQMQAVLKAVGIKAELL